MCRPPGAATTVAVALTVSLLFMPTLSASRQHEQLYHRKSPHERNALGDHNTESRASAPQEVGAVETTQYRYMKDTTLNQEYTSAVTTNPLALAGENRAVRAVHPARGSGKSAGLSTPLNARSLQDWEVEDFVLLATVDGSMHARDRKTGAARWELEVEKPMVETTYHHRNKSLLDQSRPDYEFLWIVEPSRDGDIYIYNQGGRGGLQKLHLTVKQLVADMSPYESVDPAVVYNAEKRTMLYTVDATTGKINKVFGSGGSFSKQPRCPKPGGLDVLDDEECGSRGSFVLGRTEYTITIQNRDTTEPICTLIYSEWGPNTRDGDLHSQYLNTMDNKYVYPLHDGSIFGLDHGQMEDRQRSYTQKLSSPVVRVFDVARPSNTDESDPQLIVLPQPVRPTDSDNIFSTKNRIFVNHTEAGGWFAMSESTYPFVTGTAKAAQCYNKDWLEMTLSTQSLSLAQRQEGFVGVHALADIDTRRDSGIPTISGPEPVVVYDSPVPLHHDDAYLPSIRVPLNSRIIGTAANNASDIFVVLVLCFILSFLYVNQKTFSKGARKLLEIRRPAPSVQLNLTSVPSTPITISPPYQDHVSPPVTDKTIEETVNELADEVTVVRSTSNTLLEPPPATLRGRADSLKDRGRPENERDDNTIRFQESSPGLDDAEEIGSPQIGKKKARRGKRGGAKRPKNRSNSTNELKGEVDLVNDEVSPQPPDSPEPPVTLELLDGAPAGTDMTEAIGPLIKIGHLSVNTDMILGYGGHGTMVYKGTFGGRDVAVKRMLKEFYEIASHEVNLLQESDDHPNVIRYFDKEIAGGFLYIALELCPASLQDVIEKPSSYSSLIPTNGLDTPNMLKQITSGLLYLHTLKIVHRDIKPQNILVSAPKLSLTNPTTILPPRLLISDFGLCKKLEGDQNSFRATTAFAAGTSGWRAPELLVDDDPHLPNSAALDLTRANTTNTSEPLIVDSQTNRRATRAIDIFSLGCVFYYCLTRGSHPFDKDGKFMREANIVKGYHNLDSLDCLGDYQWEAKDLIDSMLRKNPKERPDAATVLAHPFFWPAEDRLEFLCNVSDAFEAEKHREQTEKYYSQPLEYLESDECAPYILREARGDFFAVFPTAFKETLGKQRKYKGDRVLDLLRAMRNKKNHYEDMPFAVKEKVGPLPGGYLTFWTRRFPSLLLISWRVVKELGWDKRDRFQRYYEG